MPIYKRGQTYWIDFYDPSGKRIQRSAKTKIKAEAQQLHDALKTKSWKIKELGEKRRYLWQEAVLRWCNEDASKTGLETDRWHLRWLDQHLSDKYLDEIDRDMLDWIKQAKLDTGVGNRTVNRTQGIVRAILNRAKDDWGWIDNVPKPKMLKEPEGRIRWLRTHEIDALMAELPEHLQAMARFSLATGLRKSNVAGLKWAKIDMQRQCAWVDAEEAKANKAISIPLNNDAVAILLGQLKKHQEYVFAYKGQPIKQPGGRAWRQALQRAGIEDFHWHDLRHTWASAHVQAGTPLQVLKELGGWADLAMVMKYAHLSPEHIRQYAGNSELQQMVTNP